MTLIQSRNLVCLVFDFEMYSFVIKIAILVNKAVLLEIIIPAAGLINPNVEELIADPDPIRISLIINNVFFYLNFYTSFYNIHYQF